MPWWGWLIAVCVGMAVLVPAVLGLIGFLTVAHTMHKKF